MNTVFFVNATIRFSENLFLVTIIIIIIINYCGNCDLLNLRDKVLNSV